jgi:hypothetical protein
MSEAGIIRPTIEHRTRRAGGFEVTLTQPGTVPRFLIRGLTMKSLVRPSVEELRTSAGPKTQDGPASQSQSASRKTHGTAGLVASRRQGFGRIVRQAAAPW